MTGVAFQVDIVNGCLLSSPLIIPRHGKERLERSVVVTVKNAKASPGNEETKFNLVK